MKAINKLLSTLQKKMKVATDIYAYNRLLVVKAKQVKATDSMNLRPDKSWLRNYKADMIIQENAQSLTKGFIVRLPQSTTKKEEAPLSIGMFSLGIMIILMFFISSCVRSTSFLGSSVVPAAQGSVKVKKDDNKNYVIQIQIKDLADVSRLHPPRESYVVWMENEQGNKEKLGQLLSSKSFLSKQMTADLKTISSYKPIKIFVTAENESNVQYPNDEVVLTTEVF